MKYVIDLQVRGMATNVTSSREDLFFTTSEDEIDRICKHIGWSQLDEDKPTAFWVQVGDGDYGDIFCTFSNLPSSIFNTVYEVIRRWESVLGPDYDQPVVGTLVSGLKNVLHQVDDARKDLHDLCQISNAQILAD